MNKSIGFKLFVGINCIIVLFAILLWIINSQFLQQYYVSQKEHTLTNAVSQINAEYNGKPQDMSSLLNQLEHNSGIIILINSSDGTVKYDTVWRSFEAPPMGERKNDRNSMPSDRARLIQTVPTTDGFYTKYDNKFKAGFLGYLTKLKNGDSIQLGIPLSSIKESVDISNNFLVFVGFFVILIGSIAAYLFSRGFTKPVLELNELAQNMSNLDFSKKYDVKTNDEIGMLGNSLNSLSAQLDLSISELKEANKKLEKDIEQKNKLEEMRKEFIYGVSHELKTPITLIQGYAEGLKAGIAQSEDTRDFYCDVIMDESKKMNKMVMELLELAQIESGCMQIEKTSFDLSYLLENVLEKFRLVLAEKDIKLSVSNTDGLIVNADKEKIEQVIANYLNNAINHIDDERLIIVNIEKIGNMAKIFVFNTGKNIPEEQIEFIWDSFYKVDKARTRAYGGAGLGLSIVREIMNLHNSSYGVANTKDGVEFWFELEIEAKKG